MPTATIGRWEFTVPEDWALKDSGLDISYLESSDGTMGSYQKVIKSDPPEPTAQNLAEYIQKVHRSGFEADERAVWTVTEFSGVQQGELYWSRLDMWDESSNYRVLSLVACSSAYALHLTLHDYECSDYSEPNAAFIEIENSMRLVAGAA
jgi:hypothetical protein